MWPASWNSRSFSRTTVWPRWMSAVVGSMPSLTRSGRPLASCSVEPPLGQHVDRVARQVRHRAHARRSVPGLRSSRLPPSLGGQTHQAAPEEAAHPLRPARPRRPGCGLDGLRDDRSAVSQDLPAIYNFAHYKASKNSEVFDASGTPIGTLTSNQNKILLESGQISPNVKNAVVSIEDSRYYEHDGVDFQGIGRALVKDILSRSAAPGASTITEQFVKDALAAQDKPHRLPEVPRGGARLPPRAALEQGQDPHRVPQHDLLRRGRLRDRGRGPHLLRRRPSRLRHRDRALRGGARALGGGAAGRHHLLALGLRPQVLPRKRPGQAQPGAGEDVRTGLHHPGTARRRDEAGAAGTGRHRAAPLDSEAPYFTSWLRQQLVDRYGAAKTFFGGLKIKSTLDLRAPGRRRRSRQLLPRRPPTDRRAGRDRQPQRRHQGDGRRPRLR